MLLRTLPADPAKSRNAQGVEKEKFKQRWVWAPGPGLTLALADVTSFSWGWWSRIPQLELLDPQGRAGQGGEQTRCGHDCACVCVHEHTCVHICGDEEESRDTVAVFCAFLIQGVLTLVKQNQFKKCRCVGSTLMCRYQHQYFYKAHQVTLMSNEG